MRRDRGGDRLTSVTLAPRFFADTGRLDGLRRQDVGGVLALQIDQVVATPLSLVLGADLGARDRGPGFSDDTLVDVNGGLNLYLLGGDNRGLYLGPRVSFAATGYDARISDTGDRFGYGGELGVRTVTASGLTAGLAVGVLNQTRGVVALDRTQPVQTATGRNTYGYAGVQLGYSF